MNNLSDKSWSSFRYALNGWLAFYQCELNARIHITIAVGVTIAGMAFRISTTEWILPLFCIALVVGCEMFNTAFELMVDKWCPELDETAAQVKDITAGAVLLSSVIAAITGCIMYVPRVFDVAWQIIESA